ncbi:MAG: T9SS type A sorting domain-containing protein [bacterium]
MKWQTCGLFFAAIVGLVASAAVGGTPTVGVYFDEALTVRSVDRLSPGQHTLYVVAEDFDAYLTAIEYQIDYPAGMTWVKDLDLPVIRIGATPDGIAQAWPTPIDAFSPVVIAKALVRWEPGTGSRGDVTVKPHPGTGFIRATAAPDHHFIEANALPPENSGDKLPPDPTQPVLIGAKPNPFNPVTEITYFLPHRGQVRLSVYDVAGRLVALLVDQAQDAGEHAVGWRAGDLPSGVYFCRLEVGDFSQNKKLMLLK